MPKIDGTTRTEVHHFPPDDPRLVVITDPTHKLFDRRTLDPIPEEFIQSIIENGVIEPVIATKSGENYIVTNGRKRVFAAREALSRGVRHKIKVAMRTMSDYEQLKVATITNVQRIDDSPSVRGFNAERLLQNGADWPELESIFGAKRNTIEGWIALYNAPEAVRSAVDAGEITPTAAVKAARKVRRGGAQAAVDAVEKAKAPKARKFVFTATETPDGEFIVSCGKDIVGDDLIRIRDGFRKYLGGV